MKPMTRDDVYCFLSEEVSTPDDQHWGSNSYTVEAKNIGDTNESILSVFYDGCLQTFGDVNFNQRIYEGEDVYGAFMSDVHAQNKYRRNKLTGELGHPIPMMEGEELSFTRLCEVPKERSAIIIRDMRLDGNRMMGHIQTDPGTQNFGVNIAKSIIGAGYVPSHSLRSFGIIRPGTERNGCKGIVSVKKFITYDLVESPSHEQANATFTPKREETMKGAYIKKFESVENFEKQDSSIIIPYQDLAYYAMQESKQGYLMEAFQLQDDSIFGVTKSGQSVILKDRDDIFYVPVTEDVHREIRDVMKKHLKSFF